MSVSFNIDQSRVLTVLGLKNPQENLPDEADVEEGNTFKISNTDLSCQLRENDIVIAAFTSYNNKLLSWKGIARISRGKEKIIGDFFSNMRKRVGNEAKIQAFIIRNHIEKEEDVSDLLTPNPIEEMAKTNNVSILYRDVGRNVKLTHNNVTTFGRSICNEVHITKDKITASNILKVDRTFHKYSIKLHPYRKPNSSNINSA